MNEQILIDKTLSGDMGAFEELIIPYEKPVYNICFRMLGNTHDAQDAAQEVFIKVYKYLNKFRYRDESSFKKWVYAITNNACIDELRKRKSRIKPESLDDAVLSEDGEMMRQIESEEPLPEDIVIEKERRMALNKAISDLPDSFRQIIVLREIRGLSYEEIAEITKMKLGTVKSKISRARAALTEQIKNNYV